MSAGAALFPPPLSPDRKRVPGVKTRRCIALSCFSIAFNLWLVDCAEDPIVDIINNTNDNNKQIPVIIML
jgi:hypothetical protein